MHFLSSIFCSISYMTLSPSDLQNFTSASYLLALWHHLLIQRLWLEMINLGQVSHLPGIPRAHLQLSCFLLFLQEVVLRLELRLLLLVTRNKKGLFFQVVRLSYWYLFFAFQIWNPGSNPTGDTTSPFCAELLFRFNLNKQLDKCGPLKKD